MSDDNFREGLGDGPELSEADVANALGRLQERAVSRTRRTRALVAGGAVIAVVALIAGVAIGANGKSNKQIAATTSIKPTTSLAPSTTTTRPTTTTVGPVPTLGQSMGIFSVPPGGGWGEVKPTQVSNGGDPTGIVSNVTWSSWGGSQAIGYGKSDYVGSNQDVADGSYETATVVGFSLGTCDGKYMYRAVEWYYPQHGENFDPNTYEDICAGTYISGALTSKCSDVPYTTGANSDIASNIVATRDDCDEVKVVVLAAKNGASFFQHYVSEQFSCSTTGETQPAGGGMSFWPYVCTRGDAKVTFNAY